MAKHAARIATCFALFLLSACVTRGPLILPNLASGARPIAELDATPFYPQSEYQCGPAALATVLAASGASITPEALVPVVYIPARKGSLQIEMQAAPRKYGRLAYPLTRNLDSILAELDAGRPVLVLHNYGVPFLPRWHYAVVVGYDAAADRVVLRSGVTRRQVLSARNFMRAWDNGGRWAMVVLRPGEIAASASPMRYFEAAADFERVASPQDARLAFDAAVTRWPSEPVGWIGRGTAEYRAGNLQAAARDYASALRVDQSNVGARNNLAMTLVELGCPARARAQLESVDMGLVDGSLKEAVLDTRRRVDAALKASGGRDAASCDE
jgi:tetratricopeptide (TPR) repeat protein